MGGRRIARLNEQLKREITEILRSEVRDPRIGRPTVTGVAVTADLWMARVFVRPQPEGAPEPGAGPVPDREAALLEGLAAAAPFIRRELGQELSLRRIPELRFEVDRSSESAARIEQLLREVLPPDEDVEG